MIKLMLTVSFRSDLAPQDAHEHWRTVHKDLVLATPGVVAYTQNRATEPVGDPVPWDGIVELTFADRARFDEAMASPEWVAVNQDAPNFAEVSDLRMALVDEEDHR